MDLSEAAFSNNMVALRRFVEDQGADVNQQNKVNQMTALHWASKGGHASIVSYLLKHGARVDVANNKGETPAQVAKTDEVRALLGGEAAVSTPAPAFRLSENATSILEPVPVDTKEVNEQIDLNRSSASATEAQPEPASTSSGPLRLKVKRKTEEDFYEIEIQSRTLEALIRQAIAEMEIDPLKTRVTKVRKLPNVLLRKDTDVERLVADQELEIETEEIVA